MKLGILNFERRPKARFGVAQDEAFCFYYPDNLELLEQAGAELVFFSPFIEQGGVVYAECGGFMYLTLGIRDVHGTLLPMVGIYPTVARMLPRLTALGYVEIEIEKAGRLFPAGRVRGHEFHYSELERGDFCGGAIESVYQIRKRRDAVPRTNTRKVRVITVYENRPKH